MLQRRSLVAAFAVAVTLVAVIGVVVLRAEHPAAPQAAVAENTADPNYVKGFFYGPAASCQSGPAPDPSDFPQLYSFPGDPNPLNSVALPKAFPNVPKPPSEYSPNILTLGGGATQWTDAMYASLAPQMATIKSNGWDGVCFDWEYIDQSVATIAGLQGLLQAAKDAGLIVALTSLAEGPSLSAGASSPVDYSSFDWTLVDWFVPQIYGGDGTMPAAWAQYVGFWVAGGGVSVQNMKWVSPPLNKILWGLTATADTYAEVMAAAPTSAGYVAWCWDPYL